MYQSFSSNFNKEIYYEYFGSFRERSLVMMIELKFWSWITWVPT